MAKDTHVAIIGGGLAGLAAAVTLSKQQVKTTLYEAGSQLGGRARSVGVEFGEQVVQLDNGQHILLGAYRETLNLIHEIGLSEEQAFMRLPLALEIFSPQGKPSLKLTTSRLWPFPLNQLFGFLSCSGLSLAERFAVIKFMLQQKQSGFRIMSDTPLRQFLVMQHQSENIIQHLWEPLCLAALNTPISRASTRIFLNVLHDAFDTSKSASDLLLPRLDLSQAIAQPFARYVQANGGEVLTKTRVKAIKPHGDHYTVYTKDETADYSHVIVATSPLRLQNVAGRLPKLKYIAELVDSYRYQPIYTVYLQYSKETRLPKPMLGLSDTLSQWVFDRGILCGQHGLMAVIISAEGEHQILSHQALARDVAQELRSAFPMLSRPLWHQVIAEKRATFSCEPHIARPANITPYRHLLIAGDYTYADYPATIEGAVRSGINAAKLITH